MRNSLGYGVWSNGLRGFAFENIHLLDHLFFKLRSTLTKMSFTMVVGAQANDIRHSICSFIGQSDYVMVSGRW
jgi:hypothetical protein